MNRKLQFIAAITAVLFIVYSLWLAMSAVAGTSEIARMVTAAKLVKPIVFVMLGGDEPFTYVVRIPSSAQTDDEFIVMNWKLVVTFLFLVHYIGECSCIFLGRTQAY